jgi:hypothetical protein
MNLEKFVDEHRALAIIVTAVAGGAFWIITTFATVSYVDKGLAEVREEKQELLTDIKSRLTRIEDLLLEKRRNK